MPTSQSVASASRHEIFHGSSPSVLELFSTDPTLRKTEIVLDQSPSDSERIPIKVPPLSIEDRRQVLYSSLLRYAPEVAPLRERVLDRVVLGALIGSSINDPFRIGKIQQHLCLGSNAPEIRISAIQETLERLKTQEKVAHTALRQRHAYYLTEKASEEVNKVVGSTEVAFNAVLSKMLANTEQLVTFETGATVCRKFIFECFARYGQVIARNVTGNISHDTLMRCLDPSRAFQAAIAGQALSDEATESLKARTQSFLRSSDQEDQKLKFFLTQGYYFTQLLGLEDTGFNPLNEHAFANSVFYLDTNVLLVGVLSTDENGALFHELISIAHRIGIEIRVTRATIDEARRVAADRRILIEKIVGVVPEQLVERTDDQFILAYLHATATNVSLSPEEFLEPFNRLPDILKFQWGIQIDDRVEDEIIRERDFSQIARTLNEAAEASRGWAKSELVLKHDVCHYALVIDERSQNPKVWFLTKDKTLTLAATKIAVSEQAFCFSLSGFLQSVSPFLTTTAEEHSFVDMFSTMFSEQVFPPGPIFEASELALMAEYHEDVMATPADQLVRAFDYIKTKTLRGKPYKRSDIPQVSLELRKFLASSRDAQIRALEVERIRLENEREGEREKRAAAEAVTKVRDGEIEKLRKEMARVCDAGSQETERIQAELDAANAGLRKEKIEQTRSEQRRGLIYSTLGIIVASLIWWKQSSILSHLYSSLPVLVSWSSYVELIVRFLGVITFCFPAFRSIRQTSLDHAFQISLYSVVVIIALAGSRLLDANTISMSANYVDVATILATLIFIIFSRMEP